MTNNSSFAENIFCVNSFSEKVYLINYQRFILMITDVNIMLLNLVANSCVLLRLIKSKLICNRSYMLIFYMNFSDCCVALFVHPVYAIIIVLYFDKSYCTQEMLLQFLTVLFSHVSVCTTAAIAFDRYARILYLNRYTEVVTKKRVVLACIAIGMYSLLHATLFAAGSIYNFFDTSRRVAAAIDILIILFITFAYLYTVKIIKDHRRSITHNFRKSVNQKFTILALKVLPTIVVFYGIYAVAKVIHAILKTKIKSLAKSWIYFILHAGYLMVFCNSLVNAILFLAADQRLTVKKVIKVSNKTTIMKDTTSRFTKMTRYSYYQNKN